MTCAFLALERLVQHRAHLDRRNHEYLDAVRTPCQGLGGNCGPGDPTQEAQLKRDEY